MIGTDISLSASQVKPARYYWMRYAADRATRVTSSLGVPARIEKGDLFGVRELRGKEFDEVLVQKTGELYQLSVAESERLMDKSKEYRGSTPKVAAPAKSIPAKIKTITIKGTEVQPVKPVARDPLNDRYQRVLKRAGVSVATLGKPQVRKLIAAFDDDIEAQRFRNWLYAKVAQSSGPRSKSLSEFIKSIVLGGPANARKMKVVVPAVRVKPVDPTIPPQVPHKAHLDENSFETEDDMYDDQIPDEFRGLHLSESRYRPRKGR